MKVVNRRLAIAVHDLCMVLLAWSSAYLVRHSFSFQAVEGAAFMQMLVVVAAAQGLVLWWTGLYRGLWRFASVPDLWNILRAAVIGGLAVSLALFLFNRLDGVPRTTLALYPLFLVFLLGAPRLIYRVWKDRSLNLSSAPECKRVLILGAGRAGEMLARDMRRDNECVPVGFLDDNPQLKGAKVHGMPVLGTLDQVARVVDEMGVDVVVIAIPSANNAQVRRVVELCEQASVVFRILPRMQDLVSGMVSVRDLREVAIDDLLGREPVSLDWQSISNGLAGKTVLISGAGGSIGSELCRQIARLGPASLVLFERGEFNLYSIEMELRRTYPDLVLHACLGDVCDKVAVEYVVSKYCPEMIFHAAAYKHVPMLQSQAREGVRNNVLGTKTLALAADKYGCANFVMISTDKAVNPTNVMGASKRVAEIFCQMLDRRSSTRFITVRFGNVLGSAGSVVPLFQKQIAAGGPVTVTHPEITRYFMTIPEACQLIMQAGVIGQGGEIFVLDMGEPVKIGYLAEQMIRLSGKIPGEDVQIVYTGLRPGEKLYEELFYAQEGLTETGHDKIMLAQSRDVDWYYLNETVDAMEQASKDYDEAQFVPLLKLLVPEMGESPALPVVPPSNVVVLKRGKR
ncbi:MAG: polysaccharide biosynthesis protein [Gammaproteobacteria bacterium]|nr:polysaccharide biosynthesis protein [Gammaproteobacteria bacterium]